MEATVANLLSSDDRALVVVGGGFVSDSLSCAIFMVYRMTISLSQWERR